MIFEPFNKLGDILTHIKDPVPLEERKGLVYQIPCLNCPEVYIGETQRRFSTRCKEHQRSVRFGVIDNASALAKHCARLDHNTDWAGASILEFETDFAKRGFLESYHINSTNNTMNDKEYLRFPNVYLN